MIQPGFGNFGKTEFSARISAVDAEIGMHRYNVHFVDIIRYSLREYESPAEFSARISAVAQKSVCTGIMSTLWTLYHIYLVKL